MLLFMLLLTMMSLLFPWLKHPLSMGLILIMQTMIVSLISGMIMNSFWFSYILFMILLGGALVLFIYMASIASNEKFNFSLSMFMFSAIMLMLMITMQTIIDPLIPNKINFIKNHMTMDSEQILSLIKLFNYQSMYLTIMLVIYLFITMVAASHIVNIQEGPLRMKS